MGRAASRASTGTRCGALTPSALGKHAGSARSVPGTRDGHRGRACSWPVPKAMSDRGAVPEVDNPAATDAAAEFEQNVRRMYDQMARIAITRPGSTTTTSVLGECRDSCRSSLRRTSLDDSRSGESRRAGRSRSVGCRTSHLGRGGNAMEGERSCRVLKRT